MANESTTANPMQAEPQKEHEWLQRLIGDWTFEAEMQEPGKAPEKSTGTQTIRAIGDLWIVGEGQGEMPGGGSATMIITLGYDPRTDRYVGTWFGSMMTHLWVYDGYLDPDGNVLTLEADGPAWSGEGLAQYRDIIDVRSNDHYVLSSRVLGDDGTWQEFMTANYRRKK